MKVRRESDSALCGVCAMVQGCVYTIAVQPVSRATTNFPEGTIVMCIQPNRIVNLVSGGSCSIAALHSDVRVKLEQNAELVL